MAYSFARSSARSAARFAALEALGAGGRLSGATNNGLSRNRIHFLFLHEVRPKHMVNFRGLVARLAETHHFLGHSEAVRKLHAGGIDKPSVSFSFDDGFASNVEAAKILESYGAKGMFFVPPTFIGTRSVDSARNYFHRSDLFEAAMSWKDLESLVDKGHEVGSHTANHVTLSELPHERAVSEIHEGAEMVRKELGECRHFAWPRGAWRYFPRPLLAAVKEAGHESCSSGVRGAHVAMPADDEAFHLRRDLVASDWPVRHSTYFIGRSANNASNADNARDGAQGD